jgi:hypothetical protein
MRAQRWTVTGNIPIKEALRLPHATSRLPARLRARVRYERPARRNDGSQHPTVEPRAECSTEQVPRDRYALLLLASCEARRIVSQASDAIAHRADVPASLRPRVRVTRRRGTDPRPALIPPLVCSPRARAAFLVANRRVRDARLRCESSSRRRGRACRCLGRSAGVGTRAELTPALRGGCVSLNTRPNFRGTCGRRGWSGAFAECGGGDPRPRGGRSGDVRRSCCRPVPAIVGGVLGQVRVAISRRRTIRTHLDSSRRSAIAFFP